MTMKQISEQRPLGNTTGPETSPTNPVPPTESGLSGPNTSTEPMFINVVSLSPEQLKALKDEWHQEFVREMSRTRTTVYKIRDKTAFDSWGVFVADDTTGLFAANTSYGSFSHIWPCAHRSQHLHSFLADLNRGYFGKKTMGTRAKVYSPERSKKMWCQRILEERAQWPETPARTDGMSRDRARELYGYVKRFDWHREPHDVARDLYEGLHCDFFGADCEALIAEEPNPQLVLFWDRLWPLFIEQLQQEKGVAA